jgi:hypothetical protein
MSVEFTVRQVMDWGKEAGDALLKEQLPLNDSIAKIASAQGINSREKIARIVEASNHYIWSQLGGNKMDQLFAFDVATGDGVIDSLQRAGAKVAHATDDSPQSSGSEYRMPPPLEASLDITVDEYFARKFPKRAEDIQDVRLRKREKIAMLVVARNKVASAQSELQASQIGAEMSQYKAEDDFMKQVEHMLLEGKQWEQICEDMASGIESVPVGGVRNLLERVLPRLIQKNMLPEGTTMPDSNHVMSSGIEMADSNHVMSSGIEMADSIQKSAAQAIDRNIAAQRFGAARHQCELEIGRLHMEFGKAYAEYQREIAS